MKKRILCMLLGVAMLLSLGANVLAEQAPEVTAEPEATVEPEATEEPEATVEPEVTMEPEAAVEPEATEVPEATEEPEVTAEPEVTEEPEATVEPEVTVAPEATEVPVVTEAPEATAEPEATEEPEVSAVDAAPDGELPVGSHVIHFLGAVEGLISAKDENGNDVKDGDIVTRIVEISLKEGYTYSSNTGGTAWTDGYGESQIIPCVDYNNWPVTVKFAPPAVLHLTGAVEGIQPDPSCPSEGSLLLVNPVNRFYEGGESYFVYSYSLHLKIGYRLETVGYIPNGYVEDGGLWRNEQGGYDGWGHTFFAIGPGTLTLHIVRDETPLVTVTRIDADGSIRYADEYLRGETFRVVESCEYKLKVEGAAFSGMSLYGPYGSYSADVTYRINDDAESVTVTSEERAPATLRLTGATEGVERTDSVNSDDTFTGCHVYLKPGYYLETGDLGTCLVWEESPNKYGVFAQTAGEVALEVKAGGAVKTLIPLRVEGDEYEIHIGDFAGHSTWDTVYTGTTGVVTVEQGYALSVSGGQIIGMAHYDGYLVNYRDYTIQVDSDATELVLTVMPWEGTPGDLTGEGSVDDDDLSDLFFFLLGEDRGVDIVTADVNRDRKVDLKDATLLYQYLHHQVDVLY